MHTQDASKVAHTTRSRYTIIRKDGKVTLYDLSRLLFWFHFQRLLVDRQLNFHGPSRHQITVVDIVENDDFSEVEVKMCPAMKQSVLFNLHLEV